MSETEQTADEETGVVTRVSASGETRVPEAVRERLGIEPGDQTVWRLPDDESDVRIVDSGATARGSAVPDDVSDAERRAVAREMDRQVRERRHGEWDPVETDGGA